MATKTLKSGNYSSYLYVDYTFTSNASARTWSLTASMKFYTGTKSMGPWGDHGDTILGPKSINGGGLTQKYSSGTTVTILTGATASGSYDINGTAPSVTWNWEWCVNSEWGGYTNPSGTVTLTGSSIGAKTYTVTYNGNGSTSGSMTASTATYGQGFKTKQNAFSKTGYTFNGWREDNAASGTYWGITSSNSGTYESGKNWTWNYTKNITLYAQWTPKSLVVEFNKNDESNSTATQSFTYGVSGNKFGYNNDGTEKWPPTAGSYADLYGFGQWYRLGYKIVGWAESASATTAQYSTYSGVADSWINSKNTNTLSTQTTPTIKLYAVWDYNGTVRIYDGSTWRMAIPYINTDGTATGWTMALPYVNEDGTSAGWKLCGG